MTTNMNILTQTTRSAFVIAVSILMGYATTGAHADEPSPIACEAGNTTGLKAFISTILSPAELCVEQNLETKLDRPYFQSTWSDEEYRLEARKFNLTPNVSIQASSLDSTSLPSRVSGSVTSKSLQTIPGYTSINLNSR